MEEPQTLKDVVRELAEERGVDLRGYKTTTLERRIRRRMQQLRMATYEDYLKHVRQDQGETARLLDMVLINVTQFFRDPPAWQVLRQQVQKLLLHDRPAAGPLRAWCAGCATGEEAYSVAILLSELLGPRVKEYGIKVYATDNDENALKTARQAEYHAEALQGVPTEIRARYFTGVGPKLVARDTRRMVIFGRSNLLADPPISHIDLLVCRNVLIYFDAPAQESILKRLKYALNDGGILFLGKSESQLRHDPDFVPINGRWRIFQYRPRASDFERSYNSERTWNNHMTPDLRDNTRQELEQLRLHYETLLATLEPAVLVLDAGDTVITENDKILKMWELRDTLVGKKLQETQLWQRCPQLEEFLKQSRTNRPQTVRFDCAPGADTAVAATIKPIMAESGAGQVGTLIYMENVTSRITLQSTVEELETTTEELQSANEELETTNEELQSSNEELETTNEELQSTNEELETTNEELQSLNEELETTNEELTSRTRELDEVNARYLEMIERMPLPVLLVNDETVIYLFNSAAQKLFGFANPSANGISLRELPLDNNTRQAMLRRHRLVLQNRKASYIRNCHFITNRFDGMTDIHFKPLSAGAGNGVIVIFHVVAQNSAFPRKGKTGPQDARKMGRNGNTPSKKNKAAKRKRK
ncbi:MAG TPA: CheR family methyltransferase [Candidatus Angelobacter sp.]|nr:CheR family methyltransferase [Candidatus Angelobacter sp.]